MTPSLMLAVMAGGRRNGPKPGGNGASLLVTSDKHHLPSRDLNDVTLVSEEMEVH